MRRQRTIGWFFTAGLLVVVCANARAAVPVAPTNLTASAVSSTQINLSWTDNSSNETSFKIERKLGSTGIYYQIGTVGSNVTTFSDTGLTTGGTYFYRVRASNSSGDSAYSNEVSAAVTGDTTPPSVPTGLTATAVGSYQINLSWTASTDNVGVTEYHVERCLGESCTNFSEVANPSGTSLSDSVNGGMTYSYRVRAQDAQNNLSGYSSVASATTSKDPTDTIPPTTPQNLVATAVGPHQVNLSWWPSKDDGDNPENQPTMSGYLVERCQGANCASFVQITDAYVDSFSDTSLSETTTYNYRVRAFDLAGNLSTYSNVASVTTLAANLPPDTTAPTAPSGLSAAGTSTAMTNAIYLVWNPSTDDRGVTGYSVFRCEGSGSSCNSNFFYQGTTFFPSWWDTTDLAAGTTYSYMVQAQDQAGNLSEFSNVASAAPQADTTPPTAPTGLSGVAVSPDQINLSWVPSTDNVAVNAYLVQSCQGASCANFGPIHGGMLGPTSYGDYPLAAATTYSYRVAAVDVAGNTSAYSNVVSVTTPNQDTTPPTTPTGLTVVSAGASQVDVSWTASTDNVGVTLYHVERCAGAGCTAFVEVATPTGTAFSDYGLTVSTSYSYRARAEDAAGNLSPYSDIVSATPEPAGTPLPTALNPDPLALNAGASGTLTATLSPAPTTAGALSISSSDANVASVPASVSFVAGQGSVAIPVTTGTGGSATITAALNGAQVTATVNVNALPTANLTAPGNGAVYSAPATIVLSASATDSDGAVVQVDFFDGGTLVGTATAAPYSVTLMNVVAVGAHTYTARATDNLGATSNSLPVTVTIDAPPTVILTAPANNAVLAEPASITLSATATDSVGNLTRVDFYQGTSLVGTAAAAPYSFTWTSVPAGNYSLTAVATNDAGGATTSTPVVIKVDAAPIVSLDAPTNGAVFAASATIGLTATATDTVGNITKVDFYQGTTLIGTVSTAPFTFNWSGVAAGTYSLTAVATNDAGMTATSTADVIAVDAAPSVSLISPANGSTFNAPATINLAVNAADSVGTVTKVDYYQGTTLIGTATASPFSFSWLNVPAGNYSLTAVATNDAGETATSGPVAIAVGIAQSGLQVYSIYPDQLNTPRLIQDQSGSTVWRNDNTEPFGDSVPNDDPNNTGNHVDFPLRFPGQYFDRETNLAYNYFRDYDASIGRYVQSDPTGLRGGLSTYAYVSGNPIGYVDLNGLWCVPQAVADLISYGVGGLVAGAISSRGNPWVALATGTIGATFGYFAAGNSQQGEALGGALGGLGGAAGRAPGGGMAGVVGGVIGGFVSGALSWSAPNDSTQNTWGNLLGGGIGGLWGGLLRKSPGIAPLEGGALGAVGGAVGGFTQDLVSFYLNSHICNDHCANQ